MKKKLILQLHVHSDRSHDSKVPTRDYINYLEKTLAENEYAVLAITDHNVAPLSMRDSLGYSTKKVIVVPGIEWSLHKTPREALRRLSSRKELITLGDQDDFIKFIENKTNHTLLDGGEVSGKITDDDFFNYVSFHENLTVVVPHPSHIFIEYYGKNQIQELYKKIKTFKSNFNFFVEEKTGSDPFPRLFHSYRGKYPILGSSDAHRIYGYFKVPTLSSVVASIDDYNNLIESWEIVYRNKDLNLYKKMVNDLFVFLEEENDKIIIKKHTVTSLLSLSSGVPAFFQRRFADFPNRLLH